MKKLKNEIQEMNITKLILLSMALTIAMIALISGASAAVPNDGTPNYGTATVNGDISEWNLNADGPDYFAPMYEGWNKDKPVLSKLYLRYHCNSDGSVTMYALVLTEPGVTALEERNNAWIAINEIDNKVVKEDTDNNGVPPDFAWVYTTTDGTKTLIGYEASFELAGAGSYNIIAHIQVTDTNGEEQTSGTEGQKAGIPLTIPGCQLVEELTVSKTADTSYTRTHKWDIDKSVTTEKEYTEGGFPKIWLYIDGHGNEKATWTVDVNYKGYEDSDFDVSGVITIKNTGTLPATITDINDVLGGTPITVVLPEGVTLPYTLPVDGTLECSYNKAVDSKIEGSNDVTVTTESNKEYKASADIVWGDPTIEKYKTITVKDKSDLFGEKDLGTVTAPNNQQFTYSKDFAWEDYGKNALSDYTYHNTATIVETGQSADATLKVNVQQYMYETAYAKEGENKAICFIPTFANWGWTNPIMPGTYTMNLWAGAAQCDTTKGTEVGTVTVVYPSGTNSYVTVTYNVGAPYLLEETHVYAGYDKFPKDKKGKLTVAPGAYSNFSPFDGTREVYVIAHAVVGIPDPNFGPDE
jgi:hypothetical protein